MHRKQLSFSTSCFPIQPLLDLNTRSTLYMRIMVQWKCVLKLSDLGSVCPLLLTTVEQLKVRTQLIVPACHSDLYRGVASYKQA